LTELDPPAPEPAPAARPALLADGSLRRLDPRSVQAARLSGWILCAVLGLLGPLGILVHLFVGGPGALRLALLVAAWLLLVAAAGAGAQLWPPVRYRHVRWRLSALGLEIRRGVVFRHWISVPRDRVQHTDVARGPIERRFGLATLVVHTAGSHFYELELDGLAHETALAVRDFLLPRGSVQSGGRDGD
jgi:hypothetical protein